MAFYAEKGTGAITEVAYFRSPGKKVGNSEQTRTSFAYVSFEKRRQTGQRLFSGLNGSRAQRAVRVTADY